ncbi:MAG: hypothetical protein V4671_24350 [Armatimonadota bacterium]
MAFYIVLNTETPSFETYVDGKMLSRYSDDLSKIAIEAGVKPFLDFFSMPLEEAASEMDLSFDEAEDWAEEARAQGGNPPSVEAEWFSPAEGLRTARTLQKHITANADTVPNAEGILFDLQQFTQILSEAEASDLKWHLAVDY